MASELTQQVTAILERLDAGEARAADELLPLVYAELRSAAGRLFRSQPPGHTLQPTVLVHEAYLRLVNGTPDRSEMWSGRAHFCRVAAMAMRQILVNHARDKRATKRGGGEERQRITLSDVATIGESGEADFLDVHEALQKLGELDQRQASICELRFFGGLTIPEVADVLGVSKRTVELDWKMAKSWLAAHLKTAT